MNLNRLVGPLKSVVYWEESGVNTDRDFNSGSAADHLCPLLHSQPHTVPLFLYIPALKVDDYCDSMIYDNKYTLGLPPVSGL